MDRKKVLHRTTQGNTRSFCRNAAPSTMISYRTWSIRVMSIINNHIQATADMLILILYLKKQIKGTMFQKPKQLTKGSIPWGGETGIHIHNIHLDPLVIVTMEAAPEITFWLLFPNLLAKRLFTCQHSYLNTQSWSSTQMLTYWTCRW